MIHEWLFRHLRPWADTHTPNAVIYKHDNQTPHNYRWHVIPRNPLINVYLHHFVASDETTMHDHPWISLSYLLSGSYVEHQPGYLRRLVAGQLFARWPATPHRVELSHDGYDGPWTLFITGPRVREWGFACPTGWIHWKAFVSEYGKVGAGCPE